MSGGVFTVRRNSPLFWCLMLSGKTSDGLVNITHNEAARAKWLLPAHIFAQYLKPLRYLTGTMTGTMV
jgi:hypothetical protein